MKIYLAGGITGLTSSEAVDWRVKFAKDIKDKEDCFKCKISCFNPLEYYDPHDSMHKLEREAMEFDLYNLRKSDLVVVNFNAPGSIGTAMELAIAKELKIPVIGLFGKIRHTSVHPWLKECCTRICDEWDELIDHVKDYYVSSQD